MKQLNELDEMHLSALQRTIDTQQQREKWHDRFVKKEDFSERQLGAII